MEEKKSAVERCIEEKIGLCTIAEVTGFYFSEINALLLNADKETRPKYWDFCLVLDFVRDEAFEQGIKDTTKEIQVIGQSSILKAALAMKKDDFTPQQIQKYLRLTEKQIKWLTGELFLQLDELKIS